MRLLPTFALLASALSFGLAIDLHGNIVSDGPSSEPSSTLTSTEPVMENQRSSEDADIIHRPSS